MDKVATSTLAISRVPNPQHVEKQQKWLHGPNVDKVATSPLPCQRAPTLHRGRKSENGYATQTWTRWLHHSLPSRGARTLNARRTSINGYAAQMWTKWLHHPCRLGGPQRSTQDEKAEMAMRPKCGQSGYITHAISGVPNARHGEKKQNWLCSPNVDKVAKSRLPSRGSPTLYTGRKSKNGYAGQTWKNLLPLPCRLEGPQCFAQAEKA